MKGKTLDTETRVHAYQYTVKKSFCISQIYFVTGRYTLESADWITDLNQKFPEKTPR